MMKKDLVDRDTHSQTFFPAAVGEAETAASPSPSPTFNAAGERVGRMGAGEAIDEPVPMESSEQAGLGGKKGGRRGLAVRAQPRGDALGGGADAPRRSREVAAAEAGRGEKR